MDISKIMVFPQITKETKMKKRNKEAKRVRLDEQGLPKSKKRFHNKDSSITSKDKMSTSNNKGGNGGGSLFKRSICGKFRMKHL